jgi:hypothetical protein
MHVQQSVVRSQLQPREPATRRMRKTHKTQRGPAKSPSCPAPAVHGLGQVRAFLAGMGTVHLDPASLTRTKQRLRFAKRKRSPSRFRAPPFSRRNREVRDLLAVSPCCAGSRLQLPRLSLLLHPSASPTWPPCPGTNRQLAGVIFPTDMQAAEDLGWTSQPQLTRRG